MRFRLLIQYSSILRDWLIDRLIRLLGFKKRCRKNWHRFHRNIEKFIGMSLCSHGSRVIGLWVGLFTAADDKSLSYYGLVNPRPQTSDVKTIDLPWWFTCVRFSALFIAKGVFFAVSFLFYSGISVITTKNLPFRLKNMPSVIGITFVIFWGSFRFIMQLVNHMEGV